MNFLDMIKILKKNSHAKGVLCRVELTATEWSGTVYQKYNNLSEAPCFPALTASQILRDDWEIEYPVNEVPKFKLHTFEEAIAALKDGKTIKRENWKAKVIERDFCDDYSVEFTIDDFEANDWIILGEKI